MIGMLGRMNERWFSEITGPTDPNIYSMMGNFVSGSVG